MKLFFFFILIFSINIYAESSYKFIHSNTYVKNPLELRDPFKRQLVKKKTGSTTKNGSSNIYKNYDDAIESKPIESIRIIGVMTGNDRRAMARVGTSSDTYIIKEGMKLGLNQAEVKAIVPGGVVLVEKIRNVYEQDEYLETVLPVSGE
jgi:type IV pilus assembly protein PilP